MPVRTVSRPSGMAAVMFFRLFAVQPVEGEEGVGFSDLAARAAGGVDEWVEQRAEGGGE